MAGNDDDEFIFVSADIPDPTPVPTADGDALITFSDVPVVTGVKIGDSLAEFEEFTKEVEFGEFTKEVELEEFKKEVEFGEFTEEVVEFGEFTGTDVKCAGNQTYVDETLLGTEANSAHYTSGRWNNDDDCILEAEWQQLDAAAAGDNSAIGNRSETTMKDDKSGIKNKFSIFSKKVGKKESTKLQQLDTGDNAALENSSEATMKNDKSGIKNKFSIFSKKAGKKDSTSANGVSNPKTDTTDTGVNSAAQENSTETTMKNKSGLKSKFSLFSKKVVKKDSTSANSVSNPITATTDTNSITDKCTSGSSDNCTSVSSDHCASGSSDHCTSGSFGHDADKVDDDECLLKTRPKVIFQDVSGKGLTDQGLILDFEFVGASYSDQSSTKT